MQRAVPPTPVREFTTYTVGFRQRGKQNDQATEVLRERPGRPSETMQTCSIIVGATWIKPASVWRRPDGALGTSWFHHRRG